MAEDVSFGVAGTVARGGVRSQRPRRHKEAVSPSPFTLVAGRVSRKLRLVHAACLGDKRPIGGSCLQ